MFSFFRDSNNKDETSLQYLSRIVSQLPKGKLSEETVESLASELSEKLARLQYSLDSLSSAVFLLSKLWGSDSDRCSNWCEKTVENLDDQLHTSVFCGSHEEISEEKFVRCAFTIGEIIQLRPKISSQRIYLCLESVISDSQTRSSAKIRGIAALTLGKICLQDEDVAKKTVGIFAQVLNTTDSWLVRNNIIIVMSDLCMRFTSIVDRYIGFIANCLKDPSTLVRKQTLR